MVRRIGFRASAARIRAGFARLPARSPARYGRSASALRSRLDRGSNPWGAGVKEKPPLPEASISNGAAYRIRTYDVLIRSQTLYPAEVTPRLVDYYAQRLNNGQAFFQKKLSNLIFNHLMQSIDSILSNTAKATPQVCRHIRKASVTEGFKVQLVRRIGFEPMTF